MVVDFFVHPQHAGHEYAGYPNEKTYNQYLSHLIKRVEESKLPILIRGMNDNEIATKIATRNHLSSALYDSFGKKVDRGEIDRAYWDDFVSLLKGHESEEMRVHGCFIGQCTEGFAVQLFAYLNSEEHWHNWGFEEDREKAEREREIFKKYERKGDFAKSNIRYGIVLESYKGVKIIKPRFWRRFGRYRYGDVTYQLIDDKTALYCRGDINF